MKTSQICSLEINQRYILKDALTFYKANIGNLVNLQQSLNATFAGENGIDAGAFKHPDEMLWCELPKGSGGNLQIFWSYFSLTVFYKKVHILTT